MSQTLTRLQSAHEESGGGDVSFRDLSSAPTASSRTTAIPRSDAEPSDRLPETVGRKRRHRSTEHEDTNLNPSRPGSKRPRSSESRDETEPLPKRIRLRRSSTRTFRAVIFHSNPFSSFLPSRHRPVHNPRSSQRKLLSWNRRVHSDLNSRLTWVHFNLRKLQTERLNPPINLPRARRKLIRPPCRGGEQ